MNLAHKRVFLSGAMSSHPSYNVGLFAEAHLFCKRAGASYVYNPAVECMQADLSDLNKPHTYWMRKCLSELCREDPYDYKPYYDVLVSLPDWEHSEGARTERMVAEACGIKCVELEDVEALDD